MDYDRKTGKYRKNAYYGEGFYGYGNPGYLSFSGPERGLRYPAPFVRRTEERDLQRRKKKRCRRGRVPIAVAILLVALAIIAGVVAAVYLSNKDPPKKTSTTKIVEVTKIQTFQGNVLLQKPWNAELNDSNSNTYKQEKQFFESAMDITYRSSDLSERYNGTNVIGFLEGSVKVHFVIRISHRVEQTIDITNSTDGDTFGGIILGENRKDPVINTELLKTITKEKLPENVKTSVEVSEFAEIPESKLQTSLPTSTPTTAIKVTSDVTTTSSLVQTKTTSKETNFEKITGTSIVSKLELTTTKPITSMLPATSKPFTLTPKEMFSSSVIDTSTLKPNVIENVTNTLFDLSSTSSTISESTSKPSLKLTNTETLFPITTSAKSTHVSETTTQGLQTSKPTEQSATSMTKSTYLPNSTVSQAKSTLAGPTTMNGQSATSSESFFTSASAESSMQTLSTSTTVLTTTQILKPCNSTDFVYYLTKMTFEGLVWSEQLRDTQSYEYKSKAMIVTDAMFGVLSESKYSHEICGFTFHGFSIGVQDTGEVKEQSTPSVVVDGLVKVLSYSSLNESEMLHIMAAAKLQNFGYIPSKGKARKYMTLEELMNTTSAPSYMTSKQTGWGWTISDSSTLKTTPATTPERTHNTSTIEWKLWTISDSSTLKTTPATTPERTHNTSTTEWKLWTISDSSTLKTTPATTPERTHNTSTTEWKLWTISDSSTLKTTPATTPGRTSNTNTTEWKLWTITGSSTLKTTPATTPERTLNTNTTEWKLWTISDSKTPTTTLRETPISRTPEFPYVTAPATTTATTITSRVPICSTADLEVRLSGGSYGRLEVKRKNCPSDTWGTVCDDMWDVLDATVVCRQQGFSETSPAYAYRGAFFGQGSGTIWANRFDCKGTEKDLSECSFEGWGNIHCSHIQDAGVSCGTNFTTNTTSRPTLPPNITTGYTTATPPYYNSQIRLVNGINCLEGRVEVYYNGMWGTVCDDGWDSYDAMVVCRMLGYSTVGAAAVCCAFFGANNNLSILMDDVSCSGSESSIYSCRHNGWYSHNCGHNEDAGVRCGGSLDQCGLAKPTVNCTFEKSNCSYTTVAVSGAAVWQVNYSSSYILNASGVAYYTNRGGLETDMANLKSPEVSVNRTNSYKIEFFYWINASSDNALAASKSVSGISWSAWQIPWLRPEEEGTWMYQCMNLGELQAASLFSVSFLASRGSDSTRIIAIDSVGLSSGICEYGLQAGICDFERPSVARYSVNCTSCKTRVPLFRWYWAKGATPSDGTGPSVDHTFGNTSGRYMYVESTFGQEGDATALIFPAVNTSQTYQSVQFFYHMYGSNIGTLKVALESNDKERVVWQKSGEQGNLWRKDCVALPKDVTVKVKFIAVKGAGPLGDIAVDDILLLTFPCPHVISCLKSFEECAYTRTSTSNNFTWGFNGEITGPSSLTACNFQTGSCNFTSNYWRLVIAPWLSYWGVTFLDPTYNTSGGRFMALESSSYVYDHLYTTQFLVETPYCEMSFQYTYFTNNYFYLIVYQYSTNGSRFERSYNYFSSYGSSYGWTTKTVQLLQIKPTTYISIYAGGYQFSVAVDEIRFSKCGATSDKEEGEIAELISPLFAHPSGKHFITFYHRITSHDTVKVYVRGTSWEGTKIEEHLTTLNSFVAEEELVCINLPNVIGSMKIVFQAIKGDNEIQHMAISASISDVNILQGECPDTIDLHSCTFEADHILCGMFVSPPEAKTCDAAVYRWIRHTGTTLTNGTGPSNDHTSRTFGNGSATSDLNSTGYYMYADASFGNPGDTTVLQLKEFTTGNFCSLNFFYHIKGSSDPVLTVFEKTRGQSNVFRSRNVDIWIPGCVMLNSDCNMVNNSTRIIQFQAQKGATPYGDISIDDISLSHDRCPVISAECDFTDSMCGYVVEYGWIWTRSSNDSYMRIQKALSKLVFPPVQGPGCISIFYSASFGSRFLYPTSLNMSIGELLYPVQADGRRRMINIPISSEMSYIEMYIANEVNSSSLDFMLHNVTFSTMCPSLKCQIGDFSCHYYCIYEDQICDGKIKHCRNGEDEDASVCPIEVSCDFEQDYLCGYSFFMVSPSKENGTESINTYLNFDTSNQVAFAESPSRIYNSTSCLRYRYYQNGIGWHRIAGNTSNSLTDIFLFGDVLRGKQWVNLQVNLPAGHYSIVFEFNTDTLFFYSSFARIDDVKVQDGPCEDTISCNNVTEFECNVSLWNDNILHMCLSQKMRCDQKMDCLSGTDELNCPLNVTCDFENGLCGYYNKMDGYSNAWRRQDAPYLMGYYNLNDNKYGPAGSFMVVGDKTSYTDSSVELLSPLFTSMSYLCRLNYSVAYYVNSYTYMYIRLYNKNGYLKDLDSMYDSYEPQATWQEKSVAIPIGQYYIGFNIYGSYFELALDDLYLSNCGPKTSCNPSTEYRCNISTNEGSVNTCLNKISVCNQKADCVDGSDEHCSYVVTCDFEEGLCGYHSTFVIFDNAWRLEKAPFMMWNYTIYDQRFGSDGFFLVFGDTKSYMSSVELFSANFSSLNYQCRLKYSISSYTTNYMYSSVSLYNKDGYVQRLNYEYYVGPAWKEITVDIPVGHFYVGFSVYGSNFLFALDNIYLYNCKPKSICDVGRELQCRVSIGNDVADLCLPNTYVCDGTVDCINGDDEWNCSIGAACDFEDGSCGYYNGNKYINNTWRLEKAPYQMGNNIIYDQTFGYNGSFMVVGETHSDTSYAVLFSANFSSLNYKCRLNYSFTYVVYSYMYMYVNLYNKYGFVKQLNYMYNYSVISAQWREMSLEIPVGHFYVGFDVHGNSFGLALDNIYLSNCSTKSVCNNATEFGCYIETETGDVYACLLQTSLCDNIFDCKDGEDETQCNFSVSCQFEETNACGFRSINGSGYTVWNMVAAPYYLYNIYMYDSNYGSSGHFMYIGSSGYINGELITPYSGPTSLSCQLHYSTAFYVSNYLYFSVNLYSRTGYVKQIDYISESYVSTPSWSSRSAAINYNREFYLQFYIYASYSHFLLDNVYLSNCNDTARNNITTFYTTIAATSSDINSSTYTTPTTNLQASTQTVSVGDCISNPIQICAMQGFEYISMPSIRGITNATDAFYILQMYENYIQYMVGTPCTEPVIALYCGLYTTACGNRRRRLICREACESIVLGCGNWTSSLGRYDSKVLGYYCKFLPTINNEPNCLNINVSAITFPGTNSTLEVQNKTEKYSKLEDIRLVGGTKEYNGRVEVKVNGVWGTLCGYISSEAAALLCGFLGFSSPASSVYGSAYGNGPKHVVTDIYCQRGDTDINNCTIGNGDYCYWYYESMGLSCSPTSVNCVFENSTCGYIGEYWILDSLKGGMTLSSDAKEGKTSFLRSPKFTLPYGGGISFTYEVHRAAKAKFGLTIRYIGWEENLFSIGAEYDGIFSECVELLSHEDQKLQLVFYETKGQSLDGNNMNIKLLDVFVQQTSCKKEMCTFESLSSCNFTVGCSDQNGYRFKLFTGSGFSPFTGPSTDFTFKNSTGHYMLADASSGAMGDSASFYTYSDLKSTYAMFLRFYYYMNGPSVGSLEVFSKLNGSHEETIGQTLRGNYGPSWYLACTVLNISVSGRYEMQFKAVRGNGTQGDIAIDDITVTTTPCPHPVSCGFEEPNNCGYAIKPSAYYWKLTPSYILNAARHSNGYHMQTVSNSSVESDMAVMQTPPFDLTRNTKCALFQFYMAGDNVGSLTVTVSYDKGTKTKRSFYVEGNQGDEWFLANIPLAYMDYNDVSIIFSAMRGQIGNDFIAVDDIVISEKACTNGIQQEVCEFDSPFTCAYQSNFSDGSEYQWTRRIGPSLTNGTGPQFDANGDPYGAYLTVDSSYGTEHQYSFVWFPAIVTSSTSKLTFYYHMYGRDNQVADLSVMFATESGLHVLAEFCCNNGDIWKFKCLDLPYTSHGVLYFKATRKNGIFGDVALDKIGLLDGNCTVLTVTCDFDNTDFKCGYQGNWKRELEGLNYVMRSEETASLISPSSTLNRSSCITFDYHLMAKDSTAGLVLVLHYAIASTNVFGRKVLFNATGQQGSMWRKGQIQVDESEAVSFYIQFLSSGAGRFSVDNIILKMGLCHELNCSTDEFICLEKCIPSAYECDKKNDCALGEDETKSCNRDIICNFETSYHCGYRNVTSSDQWFWVNSRSSNLDDYGIFGNFLLAYPSYYSAMSLQSPTVNIQRNMCLRFDYYSTGILNVTLNPKSPMDWFDNSTHQYWRQGQADVSPGDVTLYFGARRFNIYDQGSVVAIDNIKLINGTCGEHKPVCPATMVPCKDNYKCVAKEKLCDFTWDCLDGSDEGRDYCNVSIQCNFETKAKCGYTNISIGATSWNQTAGSLFQIPQFDNTYGTSQGHFVVVTNRQDPLEYLVRYSTPVLMVYNHASLISPLEDIQSESCVEFYYYLNGSAVRPNPLSAQLLVYVSSGNQKTLVWYDHVNRTINGWLKGWVPVPKGNVRVIFEAKTTTTLAVWPGVVALDDVSLYNKTCSRPLDCGPDTFRCTLSRVCIPLYLQCDGGNDCLDGSDEDSCNSKPNYEVRLVDGDMSYGSIAIFYQGRWLPVCYDQYNSDTITSLTCKRLGYSGQHRSGYANSWHKNVTAIMSVTCSYYHTNLSQCSMYATTASYSCSLYQAVLCSNTECFSGERICPNSTKCVPVQYFCDGIPDCDSARDEMNCVTCNRSEFECANHQCIPVSQRCDGTVQCRDASDEYRCVIIEDGNGTVSVLHSLSNYLPVCVTNMTNTVANLLCKLSGRGISTSFTSAARAVEGLKLIANSSAAGTPIPGFITSLEESCYPIEIRCTMYECGTSYLTDSVVLPKILYGREATLGQFPWQIALYGYSSFYCGGSIIHPNWVLTAAHCVDDGSTFKIRLGAVDLNDISQGLEKQVSRIYIHPSYVSFTAYDMALLYFSTPIVMNEYIRPACLSSRQFYQELLGKTTDAECYVTGWGRTEKVVFSNNLPSKLQMTKIYLIDYQNCKQIWTFGIQNTTVCIDNANPGLPVCNGDSGGPLVCRNKYGRLQLLGVTSFGHVSCTHNDYPNGYQLVYPYMNWIRSVTGLNFTDFDF